MARLLFTVKDRFAVRGRGLVILPGIVPEGKERFCIGDCVELRHPNKTTRRTHIAGLELMCPMPPDGAHAVLLSSDLTKDDVPVGTEVWSTS
jgi:hypothetical protein